MPAAIGYDRLEQLDRQGYLIVQDVFSPQVDFAPLMADYSAILNDVAGGLLAAGNIESYNAAAPFQDRVLDVVRQSGGLDLGPFDITLPQKDVRAHSPIYLGKAVFNILRHPRLLDIVESLLGSEIYSNPIQHIRMKVPQDLHDNAYHWSHGLGVSNTTSWHQDGAVATEDSGSTDMITAWVAITDATIENGCLALIPGSHLDGLAGHCVNTGSAGTALVIAEQFIPLDRMTPVPICAGSVLFFRRHTMHRALPNLSDSMRWSLDLRYQPVGQPTGREAFPGFVARSRKNPGAELHDHSQWVKSWHEARAALSDTPIPADNRWKSDAPWCA